MIRRWPGLLRWVPRCQFHDLTGWDCPGCGGTRCVMRLAHADLLGALAMNPLLVAYLSFAVGWIGLVGFREWLGNAPPVLPSWIGWLLGGGVILFGILRNVPCWPFILLAPPA